MNSESLDLRSLLDPQSVAIIGASSDLSKLSGRPLKYLLRHGFQGNLYPVNPGADSIAGIKCWPSVKDLPEAPDLALILLPASAVLKTLNQCGEKRIRAVIIASSGFAETGPEGKQIQDQIAEVSRQNGLTVLGPNSIGLVNLRQPVAATFSAVLELEKLIVGDIAFITQSGALGGSLFSIAQERGIGFSHWVHTGNEACLDSLDVMAHLIKEVHVKTIISYIESLPDEEKLSRVAQLALGRGKPLVIMKVGRSATGQKAAVYHTGLSTGDPFLYDRLFEENGIIQAEDTDDLFDISLTFSKVDKLPAGPRVGLVTTSGGAGVFVSDKCLEMGLEVPELTGETRKELQKVIPAYGSAMNPIDITAQGAFLSFSKPNYMSDLLDIVLKESNIDLLMLVMTMVVGKEAEIVAEQIVEVSKRSEKPLLVCWIAGGLARDAYQILRSNGVPLFENLTRCLKAIQALVRWEKAHRKAKGLAGKEKEPWP